jgi:hypothetical protein
MTIAQGPGGFASRLGGAARISAWGCAAADFVSVILPN